MVCAQMSPIELVACRTPRVCFVFIVPIEASSVVQNRLIRFVVYADITVPQVSVQQYWFDLVASGLKRPKESRDYFLQSI